MRTNILFKTIVAVMLLSVPSMANSSNSISDIFRGKSIKASGEITTNSYNVKSFNKIEISSIARVVIVEGSGDITLKADSNIFPYVEVYVSSNELVIGLKDGISIRGGDMVFDVIVPHSGVLKSIDLSGAARISSEVVIVNSEIDIEASGAAHVALLLRGDDCTVDASGASNVNVGIESKDVEIDASGASDIEAYINATNCDVDASGASNITLKGESDTATMRTSGASDINARMFNTSNVKLDSSGASSILSNSAKKGSNGAMSGKVEIVTSGSSDIYAYINSNSCSVCSSGASSVELQGNTENSYMEASGSSDINAKELSTSLVQSHCTGAGSISLNNKRGE